MFIKFRFPAILLLAALVVGGCFRYDNFTAYFNTFYNMERIMWEVEDEFEFQDEKVREYPNLYFVEPDIYVSTSNNVGYPPFMEDFVINQQQRQPVENKIDSIVQKGSKILAHKPKSEYVQGSLYLMAKAFFYQNDWLNSQVKCSELVDKYPDGKWSPDAHLLYAKNLLVQRKFYAGEIMLSRTVDISWQLKRYDILSEAFRLEAELQLYQDDIQKAMRPYQQAIVQSEEGELKARWQVELAALLYRAGRFELAAREFAKVRKFSPDYLATFESYIYQASAMAHIGMYEDADELLDDVYRDGKYEEWQGYTYAIMANVARLKAQDSVYNAEAIDDPDREPVTQNDVKNMEKFADSAFVNNPLMKVYYHDRGMDFYLENNYRMSRNYFAKSRLTKTPVFKTSGRMFDLLNEWDRKKMATEDPLEDLSKSQEITDSTRAELSKNLFELGRIHEELGNKDSVEYYFGMAAETVKIEDEESARYIHAYARVVRPDDAFKADSLLDVIVATHPMTDYGQDAIGQLGYTQAFVIDTVADLFTNGMKLMQHREFDYSIGQFSEVYSRFPESDYAPRAVYNLGWIYEREKQKFDSALYYYRILIDEYPETEYARDVQLSVDYKLVLESGDPMPDSLKEKKVVMPPKRDIRKDLMPSQNKQVVTPPKENEGFNPMEFIKNPKKILSDPAKIIENPGKAIKELDIDNPFSNPKEFFKLEEGGNNESVPDTTGKSAPPENPEKK
jgi:TolA-binding protein